MRETVIEQHSVLMMIIYRTVNICAAGPCLNNAHFSPSCALQTIPSHSLETIPPSPVVHIPLPILAKPPPWTCVSLSVMWVGTVVILTLCYRLDYNTDCVSGMISHWPKLFTENDLCVCLCRYSRLASADSVARGHSLYRRTNGNPHVPTVKLLS